MLKFCLLGIYIFYLDQVNVYQKQLSDLKTLESIFKDSETWVFRYFYYFGNTSHVALCLK